MQFRAEINYTMQDVRQFDTMHQKLRARVLRVIARVLMVLCFLVIAAAGALMIWWGSITSRQIICYAFLLFMLVLWFVLKTLALRQKLKTLQSFGSVVFTTNETTISEKAESLTSEYAYTAFCDIVHYKGCYYLYVNKQQAFMLPERCFTEGDPAAFGRFIEEKTGLKLKEIK